MSPSALEVLFRALALIPPRTLPGGMNARLTPVDQAPISLDDFLKSSSWAKEQRRLANADIRTTVITGFQDEDVLYDIFYRINTGSVPLSSQELRQVLNRGGFARYLLEVTGEPNPLWSVLQIDSPDPRLRDVELLLRLIAWRRFSRDYKGNMKPFLDDTMKDLNKTWKETRPQIETLVAQLFEGTEAAAEIFGENWSSQDLVDR